MSNPLASRYKLGVRMCSSNVCNVPLQDVYLPMVESDRERDVPSNPNGKPAGSSTSQSGAAATVSDKVSS